MMTWGSRLGLQNMNRLAKGIGGYEFGASRQRMHFRSRLSYSEARAETQEPGKEAAGADTAGLALPSRFLSESTSECCIPRNQTPTDSLECMR